MNRPPDNLPARETRHLRGLELREAPKDSGLLGVLAGYAAVFDSDSVKLGGYDGGFIERVARGAFKRSLTESPEVFALWQHDPAQVIARSPDTLTLAEDERGLRVEIGLPDTTTARDLLARVRAKIVDAMSFGFTVREQTWQQRDGQPDLRTLTDVDLFEVSAVVWPAYPETTLAVRSHEQWRKSINPPASSLPAPASIFSERSYWESRLGLRK
jgi:HK97 family phage prohead protease